MIYGYCRISTLKQSLERQVRNIQHYCLDAVIVQEIYTGTKQNRPEWDRLCKKISQGDTIVFDSVSRFSRNAAEGFKLYKELYNNGVSLVFLKEPHINTDTYKQTLDTQVQLAINSGDSATDKLIQSIGNALNEYMMSLAQRQIQLAFEQSQKEVDDLHTRTSEGMKTSGAGEKISKSRTGNTYSTAKSRQAKLKILEHSISFKGSLGDKDLQSLTGISRNSFYKYKAEIKDELVTLTYDELLEKLKGDIAKDKKVR